MAKRRVMVCLTAAIAVCSAFPQMSAGISLGGGMGTVRHNFTDDGTASTLAYTAPLLYVEGEFDSNDWYFKLGVGILVAPVSVTLGGENVALGGYEMNSAADLTAFGIGMMKPIAKGLKAGGDIGFHVSSVSLLPSDNDPSLLTLDGYYGTIGLCINPRLRYSLSDRLVCTLTAPIGFDFGPMSDEVVTTAGPTGTSNPAIVRPSTLKPEFTGLTAGVNLSVGYFFPLK